MLDQSLQLPQKLNYKIKPTENIQEQLKFTRTNGAPAFNPQPDNNQIVIGYKVRPDTFTQGSLLYVSPPVVD